jgi:isopenicillin N synthase-like dioxygenase
VSQNVFDADQLKTLRAVADCKEYFDIGADRGTPARREPNRFPPKELIPGFEEFMLTFFWDCHQFGLDILRAIAIGLGIDEDYLVDFHQDADHLRK